MTNTNAAKAHAIQFAAQYRAAAGKAPRFPKSFAIVAAMQAGYAEGTPACEAFEVELVRALQA